MSTMEILKVNGLATNKASADQGRAAATVRLPIHGIGVSPESVVFFVVVSGGEAETATTTMAKKWEERFEGFLLEEMEEMISRGV